MFHKVPTHTVVLKKLAPIAKQLYFHIFFYKNDRELTGTIEFYYQLYPASEGYENRVD